MKLARISEAEWEVMRVIWRSPDLTANEIVESLNGTGWAPPTVKTMLNRLIKKQVLGYTKAAANAYLYHALVSEEACQKQATESFVSRVLGGSATPLLAHFVRTKKLTPEEIAELRRLLSANEEK